VTVKLLAIAALASLLAPKADVRFEAEGLRVEGVLVTGRVLEVKNAGSAVLLASGSSVEALKSSLDIVLSEERTLVLDPGIRVSRTGDGYRFTSHRAGPIKFSVSEETISLDAPVAVSVTAEGWRIGDRSYVGRTLQASVQGQDDAETNLDKMLKSKEKMQSGGGPKPSNRTRLFIGDPLTPANAAGSVAVRQIFRVTPDGGP
jgi:hypothetical protein